MAICQANTNKADITILSSENSPLTKNIKDF